MTMVRIADKLLLRVSKGKAEAIGHFKFGAYISSLSGLKIDEITELACKDRFRFAVRTLSSARDALSNSNYRVAVGRSYYAMYHAARAVAYFEHQGDDHEAHSELPGKLPQNFPNRGSWENKLKNARLDRNKADYDPYPKSDRAFSASASVTLQNAEDFIREAKGFLAKAGCKI